MTAIESTRLSSRALKIDAVEVVGLDIVPAHRRRMSTGAYLYSDKGDWGGRPVMVGIRAGGLVGWGEARPINPFVSKTAASMVAEDSKSIIIMAFYN